MLKDLDSVDLNEVPDAPTVSMKAKKAEEDRQAEIDNRITDRRGGPRRKTSTSLPQSPGGILDSIRYQITSHWFLVALLVVLAAIFTIHLFITR